jgi:replicative DNA helicase
MTMEIGSLLDKVPPQNLEAEQSALGAMMIDREALEKGIEILKPDDFYREAHKTIFDALVWLAERNEPVDIVTVQEELRSHHRLEDVGGTEYLMAIIDCVPSSANIEYYANIVEEKSILRRVIDAGTRIISMGHGEVEDAHAVVDQAERVVFGVERSRAGDGFTGMGALANDAFLRIEAQYRQKTAVTGLATGFHRLDDVLSGLQPSDLVIVAARPSMGKTAFVLDIARHVGVQEGQTVAIFSLEMSKEQLAIRMICSESRVDSHRMRTGYLCNDEWPALADGFGRLSPAPMEIDDNVGITPMGMKAKCRRLKAEKGLALIIVDYLQLIHLEGRQERRDLELGKITKELKSLARELHVPVIALSQLSREVENRPDKHPMLSDLRESGCIEQDADVVLMLYRPKYYQQKGVVSEYNSDENTVERVETPDIAEVIIAKQRNGPTCSIKLLFEEQYACFSNLEERRTEE